MKMPKASEVYSANMTIALTRDAYCTPSLYLSQLEPVRYKLYRRTQQNDSADGGHESAKHVAGELVVDAQTDQAAYTHGHASHIQRHLQSDMVKQVERREQHKRNHEVVCEGAQCDCCLGLVVDVLSDGRCSDKSASRKAVDECSQDEQHCTDVPIRVDLEIRRLGLIYFRDRRRAFGRLRHLQLLLLLHTEKRNKFSPNPNETGQASIIANVPSKGLILSALT